MGRTVNSGWIRYGPSAAIGMTQIPPGYSDAPAPAT